MTISPDDKMDAPIDDVLYWSCRLIKRASAMMKNEPAGDMSDAEMSLLEKEYWEKEEELRQAYLVVLKLRSKEIADHCEAIGFKGVTEKFVKENPFLMALAYGKFCEISND
tara:strand:- start:29 stop:361 length:333 start_codon:yes stop_codon:yes gene_type:complete